MPDGTLDTITLALILTGAGTTVAATLIASVIEIGKRLPGVAWLIGRATPGAASTVLAGVLVIYAFAATTPVIDAANSFAAFLAWVGIAGLSGKAYDVGRAVRAK